MVPSHQQVRQQISHGHGGGTTTGTMGTTAATYPMTPRTYARPAIGTPSTPHQRITSPKITPTPRRARSDKTPKPGTDKTPQASSPLQEPNPNIPHRTGFNGLGNGQGGPVKSPKTVTAGQFHANVAGLKRPIGTTANRPSPMPVKDVKEPLQKTIGFAVPGAPAQTIEAATNRAPVTGQVAARLAALENRTRASGNYHPQVSRFRPPLQDAPHISHSSKPCAIHPGGPSQSRQSRQLRQSSSASSYGPSSASQIYSSDTSADPLPSPSDSIDSSDESTPCYNPPKTTNSDIKKESKGKPYNHNRAMREMPKKTPRYLRQRAREAELEQAKRAEEGTVVNSDGPTVPQGQGVPDRLGSWQVGKEVGTGANGFVRVCRSTRTGCFAAIKVVPKVDYEPSEQPEPLLTRHGQDRQDRVDKMLNYLEREVAIMKMIDHPSLIRLWDVYETPANLYLLMEYVEGGELFDYLLDRRFFGPDECSHFFQQIVSGVQHLHQLKISHRDLKPENILLTRAYEIKVADFGLAALQPENQLLESSCGSPHYAAPEIISGKIYEGPLVDVWSIGVMLFACLTGTLPFSADESDLKALLRLIILHEPEIPASVPSDARNLLKGMLQKDPQRRIQLGDVANHPFCRRSFVATIEHRESLARFWTGTDDDALDQLEEIDMSTFAAARCMLPRLTEGELLEALMSDEPNEAKLVYWALTIEQKAELYREDEGWTFAAMMDDEIGLYGVDGKKWLPKPSDPGPVRNEERDHKRELIRTRDRFRYRRVCVPDQIDTRCQLRFRNYKRLPISVIMSKLINGIPYQSPFETQAQSVFHSKSANVNGPIRRPEERARRLADQMRKTRPTDIKRMKARLLPWISRQTVPDLPTYRVRSKVVLDRRVMSVKMARTIPWKEPREIREVLNPGTEERQKFRSELLSYSLLNKNEDGPARDDDRPQRHWLKVEVREWPSSMISTVRQLPPTPTSASPIMSGYPGLAPSPIPPNGPHSLSPVMGYPPFSSAPPTPRPHVIVPGPNSAVLPPAPFPGARGALPQIPQIAVSQIPFRPSQAVAPLPPTVEARSDRTAPSYCIDHRVRPQETASSGDTPLMTPWPAQPRPPTSPGGPRPLPTRRETAPATSTSPAPCPSPALQIPAVQPRRSPALNSGPKPVHGFQTTPIQSQPQSQSATPTQNPSRGPGVGMLATPRQPIYPPVPKLPKTSPAPLVHPQPRRVYERPAAPMGGRSQFQTPGDGSENGTPKDVARSHLLSPATIVGGQFARPATGGLRQGNRAAKPAPLPLQYTSAIGSPQSNYSHLDSPMDTPNLSVLVTPTLGSYEPTSPRGTVLQDLPNPTTRRGWVNKTFGSNALYHELLSPQDCTTTRNECSKVLSSFGAVVQIEDAENWGCLKVRSDEIRDVSGIMVNKPIRFKMEFAPKCIGLEDPMSPRSPRSPATLRPTSRAPCTIITITYEKGSADAFHAVYGRLKAEYGLGGSPNIESAYIAKQQASPYASNLPHPSPAQAGLGMGLPEIPLGDAFTPDETAFIHRRSAALR